MCNVFLSLLVYVIVGILVIDMIKILKEIMDFGSNIIGFLKLIYRGMRYILKVFIVNVIWWIIICEDIVFNRLYCILVLYILKYLYIKSEYYFCWNICWWIFRDGMWLWSECGLRNFKWIDFNWEGVLSIVKWKDGFFWKRYWEKKYGIVL